MKTCSKCRQVKPKTDFNRKKSSRDGLNSQCRPCNKETKRAWNEANREKYLEMKRSHYRRNKEKISLANKEYYRQNREKVRATNDAWSERNRERHLESKRRWYEKNKDRHRALGREWLKRNAEKKRQDDRRYYLDNRDRVKENAAKWKRENLDRVRGYYHKRKGEKEFAAALAIRSVLKNFLARARLGKDNRTCDILGYDAKALMCRMECQFSEGQSWENYGEWHIDHKIPVSHFIAKGEVRPHIVNSLSNLQPLWAEENLSKGAKLPEELAK